MKTAVFWIACTSLSGFFCNHCLGITVGQLSEILQEQRQILPQAGSLDYTLKRNVVGGPRAATTLWNEKLTFQIDKERYRVDREDSRDGDSMPLDSQSGTQIRDGQYSLIFMAGVKNTVVWSMGGQRGVRMDDLFQHGVVDPDFFARDFVTGIDLEEARVGDSNVLRVQLKFFANGKPGRWVFDLDPSLGYRCVRRTRYYSNGYIAEEIATDDYRDVGGYLIPFSSSKKKFNFDGSLSRQEEVQLNSAEFDGAITDEDYVVDVTEGTTVACTVLGMEYTYKTTEPECISLQSVLERSSHVKLDRMLDEGLRAAASSVQAGAVDSNGRISEATSGVAGMGDTLDTDKSEYPKASEGVQRSLGRAKRGIGKGVVIVGAAVGVIMMIIAGICRYRSRHSMR